MLGNWLMRSPLNTHHPLYDLDMRQRRWWQIGYRPLHYGLEIIAWTVMVLLIGWVLFVAGRYLVMVSDGRNGLSMPMYRVTRDTWTLLLWGGGISIGLSYLLDFVLMAFTVNSISGERAAHRWDLIQLTPLSGQSILETMHATNQFRMWRLTMIIIGTRVAIAIAIVLQGLFVAPILEDNTLRYTWSNLWDYPVQSSYLALLYSLIAVVLITEPIWRLRATTALAMGISAQMQRLVTSMALAFPLLLGVWIAMAAAAAGGMWLMVEVVEGIYDWLPGYSDSEEMVAILVIFAFFVAEAAYIYYTFNGIQRLGLRWAMRRAIDPPEQWQLHKTATLLPWWNAWRWWLPHSSVWQGNPIFQLNVRGITWFDSMAGPQRRMWSVGAWVVLSLLIIYTAGFAILAFWSDPLWVPLARVEVLKFSIGAAAMIGVVLLVGLDILVSAATARTINSLRVSINDDLLRLTHLPSAQLVAGCRALARLRSWSVLSGLLAFTVVCISLFYMGHFAEWYIRGSVRTFTTWTWDFITFDLVWLSVFVITVVTVTLVKVRLVVAVTIALAMRLDGILLELARAAALLALILVQMFIFLFYAWSGGSSPEWGVMLAAAVLAAVTMAAAEQGALAFARHAFQRER